MQFTINSDSPARQRVDCLVVAIFSARQLSTSAQLIDKASGGQLSEWLKASPADGTSLCAALTLYGLRGIHASRVVIVGLGAQNKVDGTTYIKALRKAADAAIASGASSVGLQLEGLAVQHRDEYWTVREAVTTFDAQSYRFDELKSKSTRSAPIKLRRVLVCANKNTRTQQALNHGQAIAAALTSARNLGNLPGNICTPSYLAKCAKALARKHASLTTKIHEEADMKRMGMGSLLSVARGSREAAKLIEVRYSGAGKAAPIALVGKGVTFDTGGISLKPGATMDEMKFDMCGAASVLGTIEAVALMKLPINVIALVPATENMPDGNASKPGDVVTTMSGQSVEILNTDAEGRLILCDALTYVERFKPDVVIDIATLTGACVVALGAHASGLWANDEALAQDLLAAGQYSGDRAWQMPFWAEYDEALSSNFADMANIGGRDGGAVTAAMFLGRFTRKLRWAHLDIAGTAWKQGKAKGSTGRPVPLLCQYLIERAIKRD
ncbi:MAG: leucyl aminopeptidase [Gammaproteobacteria bacterium]|jgi:leucyl aminopeptidase